MMIKIDIREQNKTKQTYQIYQQHRQFLARPCHVIDCLCLILSDRRRELRAVELLQSTIDLPRTAFAKWTPSSDFWSPTERTRKKTKKRENVVCVCERRRRTVGRRDAETRQTEESYGSRLSAPDDGRRPGDVFAFAFSYPGSSPPPCPKRKEGRGGGFSTFLFSLVCVVYVSAIASHTTTKSPSPSSKPSGFSALPVGSPSLSSFSLSLSLPFSSLRIQQSLSLSFLSRPDGDEASWPANRGRTPIDRERAKSTRGGGGGGCCETTYTRSR